MTDASFFYPGTNSAGVVLVHGLTGTPTEMRYVGRGLNERGYTVYAPVLAGHCGTEAELLRTGWRDWMESTEQACDWLAGKVDRLYVAGLSMGALLSLQMAARRPQQVRGIALYSTTLWYDGWSLPVGASLLPLILRLPFGKRYRYVEAFPYGIKNERIRKFIIAKMEAGDSVAAGLRGTPGQSLAELLQLIGGTKRRLPNVEAPTLIVHAANDDVTSVRNADYVAKRLRSPVRRVLLEDSYHMITIDGERDRVAALTAEFFDSIQEQPASVPALRAAAS